MLHVGGSSGVHTKVKIEATTATGQAELDLSADPAGVSYLNLGDEDSYNIGYLAYFHSDNSMRFQTNSAERMRIDSSGNLKFNSGYGSVATAYGCRAWVSFNGTGTVAINASGNVSSITDSSTGNYQVNFTTAMPDANYVTNVTPLNTVSSDYGSVAAVATSSVSVVTFQNSGSAVDVVGVYVTVLR